jgi:cyclopropane fatty-acyl-phospholipid synthase-like methyltransferase
MSCLDEKSYNDYFQCVRNYVNSKNSFEGASYFIRTNSRTEAIKKDEIFPGIYMPTILNYHSLAFLSKTYRLKLEYLIYQKIHNL